MRSRSNTGDKSFLKYVPQPGDLIMVKWETPIFYLVLRTLSLDISSPPTLVFDCFVARSANPFLSLRDTDIQWFINNSKCEIIKCQS